MKKLLTYLLLILMASAIVFLSIKYYHLRSITTSDGVSSKPDTVYVNNFFKSPTEYKVKEIPRTLYFFFTDSVKVKEVVLEEDNLKIVEEDSTTLNYSTYFLTQYPYNPKLLGLDLTRDKLSISLLNTQGKVFTEEYSIDTRYRNYRYTDKLTSKNINFFQRIQPFTQITVRPINNLWDVDLGLNYNTSKINYEIGINGFYYKPLPNKFGWDLFLRLRYNF